MSSQPSWGTAPLGPATDETSFASTTSQEPGRATREVRARGLEVFGRWAGTNGASREKGGTASSSMGIFTRAIVFGEGVAGSEDMLELVSHGGGGPRGGDGTLVEIGGGRSPGALGARPSATAGPAVAGGSATPPLC